MKNRRRFSLTGSLRTTIRFILPILSFCLFFSYLPVFSTETNNEYLENGLLIWREPQADMEFVWLVGKCFEMGQGNKEKKELLKEAGKQKYRQYYSDEIPRHKVCLDGFWLARHEVTKGQWLKIMGTNPFSNHLEPDSPAEEISWEMTREFIDRFNSLSGNKIFRLPTEAEWEYGARSGTDTPFNIGPTITTEQANYNGHYVYGNGTKGTYREKPLPVGNFKANAFGLFDMHGNVWEWCSDWYDNKYYNYSPRDNPPGAEVGEQKILRGGSWYTAPRSLRSANRHSADPESAVNDYGFRLVAERPAPGNGLILFNQDF